MLDTRPSFIERGLVGGPGGFPHAFLTVADASSPNCSVKRV
jgi:hypothetical protein